MQGIPQVPGSEGNKENDFSGSAKKPTLSWQTPPVPPKPATPQPAPVAPKVDTPKPIAPKANTASVAESSPILTYAIIFLVGLILGTLIGWAISRGTPTDNSAATTTPQGTLGTINLQTGSGAGNVEMNLEQKAGSKIAVSKVSISKPTWIVVYDNVNGTPGRALGATLFFPASNGGDASGTIDLLRPTIAGTTYLVVQLTDDGDYLLSFQKDKPVLDSNGKLSLMTLSAK